MGKMLSKKKRALSAEEVRKFLLINSGRNSYDVIVLDYTDETKVVDVFNNITVAFVQEHFPHGEDAYSISVHYGDDIDTHNIPLSDLPPQNKSYFDSMSCSDSKWLVFHSSWHKALWIHIIVHDNSIEHQKEIIKRINEMMT